MKKIPDNKKPQVAIYQGIGDDQKISVRIEDENAWLTQKLIAELFDVSIPTVNEHLKNIFESAELLEHSVIRNFRITATDGKEYDAKHYNLEVILSVGYRVRSDKGTQFRTWATEKLREYLIKGFTMDDERGFNPTEDFLKTISPGAFCEAVIEIARQFQRDNNFHAVYITESLGNWHALSNREKVQEYLVKRYCKDKKRKSHHLQIAESKSVGSIYEI